MGQTAFEPLQGTDKAPGLNTQVSAFRVVQVSNEDSPAVMDIGSAVNSVITGLGPARDIGMEQLKLNQLNIEEINSILPGIFMRLPLAEFFCPYRTHNATV